MYSPEQPQGEFHWETQGKIRKNQGKKETFPNEVKKEWEMRIRRWLIERGMKTQGDNIAKRHFLRTKAADLSFPFEDSSETCIDLHEMPDSDIKVKKLRCYGCSQRTSLVHSVYFFSCKACGDLFQSKRMQERRIDGCWSVVVGGRTKVGYQVVLKTLRAGGSCIVTTRYPSRAESLYRLEADYSTWSSRLFIYPVSLDLLSSDLQAQLQLLLQYIQSLTDHIDILINNAAQTIRAFNQPRPASVLNRYGDPKNVVDLESSWSLKLHEISFEEWKETFTVTAVAPGLIISTLLPVLRVMAGPEFAYVVNVHAREGLMQVRKGGRHIHTNMAKTALGMLTRSLCEPWSLRRPGLYQPQRRIRVVGVDPGWTSTEEYMESECSVLVPPLDEIDGAARVMQPVWEELRSDGRTIRHFTRHEY